MELPKNRTVEIHFYLNKDALFQQQKLWNKIKKMFYSSNLNQIDILEDWRSHMKLISNKLLPISNKYDEKIDNNTWSPIVIIPRQSDDDLEKWTLTELLDLKDAFEIVLNKKLEEECCTGLISIY